MNETPALDEIHPRHIKIELSSGEVSEDAAAWLYRDGDSLLVFVANKSSTIGIRLTSAEIKKWMGL